MSANVSTKERINISQTVANIASNLPQRLGNRYRVSLSPGEAIPEFQAPRSGSIPDIFVYDNQTNALTMIEVDGPVPSFDQPLATVPELDRVRATFGNYDTTMVLVTGARVPGQLQSALQNDNIELVQYRDLDQTLSELANVIKKSSKGHTDQEFIAPLL